MSIWKKRRTTCFMKYPYLKTDSDSVFRINHFHSLLIAVQLYFTGVFFVFFLPTMKRKTSLMPLESLGYSYSVPSSSTIFTTFRLTTIWNRYSVYSSGTDETPFINFLCTRCESCTEKPSFLCTTTHHLHTNRKATQIH